MDSGTVIGRNSKKQNGLEIVEDHDRQRSEKKWHTEKISCISSSSSINSGRLHVYSDYN